MMKKLLTVLTMFVFVFSMSAKNEIIEKPVIENDIVQCLSQVSVDCDGDGQPDYVGTVDCAYELGLIQTFMDAC